MKQVVSNNRSLGMIVTLAMMASLITLPLTGPSAQAALTIADPLDRIVAVVNDQVITALELDKEMQLIKQQLRQQNTQLPPDAVLQRQLLERLILRNIQLQIANRGSIRVDEETLNRTVENIAAQNRMSLGQFRDTLAREGLDYEDFRENMREEITINRLQQSQVTNRIVITQQEIDTFISNQALRSGVDKEFHLGHILISVPEAASAENIAAARAKAEKVVAELRAGADFYQTAVSVSDGQQALEGGDLGWRRAAALPTLFADWVLLQQDNSISDALRSPSGFHIIKLLDQRSPEARHVVTQSHARHILIRPELGEDNDQALARLHEIRRRLLDGEDFASLARAESKDPGSAVQGGDLGWVNPGEMVPEFEQAMQALAVNEISQPVRTQFGWHVLQVLERRDHDNTAKVQREKAQEVLRARKTDPAMQAWIRRIRDEAFVENRL
ncbi:MAG: peptidylprolyl isomerase [Gammaproteobacteria bacterium]|nr:peptidylprolyl isomerase [Gammaproteobacteria bacterium]